MVKTHSSTQNSGASQTKRLCVRNSSTSDDSRSGKSIVELQQLHQTTNLSNMTASTTVPVQGVKQLSKNQLDSAPTDTLPLNNNSNSTNSPAKNDTFSDSNGKLYKNQKEELVSKILKNNINQQTQLDALVCLRDYITGCNFRKEELSSHPLFNDIVSLLDQNVNQDIKIQTTLLICSLIKTKNDSSKFVKENDIVVKLINLINKDPGIELLEACLRCLRSIFYWVPSASVENALFSSNQNRVTRSNSTKDITVTNEIVFKLINYINETNSLVVQECTSHLFSLACNNEDHQRAFCNKEAIDCLFKLLESSSFKVVMAALDWLSKICHNNKEVSKAISETRSKKNKSLSQILLAMMDRTNQMEMQLIAAINYAYIFRALNKKTADEPKLVETVLSTLVRMVQKEKPPIFRIKAALCLSYFVEDDPELQTLASIHDHLILSLNDMLEFESSSLCMDINSCLQNGSSLERKSSPLSLNNMAIWSSMASHGPSIDLSLNQPSTNYRYFQNLDCDEMEKLSQKMIEASLLALCSLCALQEEIRMKVGFTSFVMLNLSTCLSEKNHDTMVAALKLLLSLSRSIHMLRTKFAELHLHVHLKPMLESDSDHIVCLTLSVLCNLVLDFSSSRTNYTECSRTLEVICKLTKHPKLIIRLHAVWILMNMLFEADLKSKLHILKTLSIEQILSLLSEPDEELLLKSLGLLRNLLSQREHIDAIMEMYGDRMILAASYILESNRQYVSNRVKEQAMCILANIAHGLEAKSFILNRDSLLTKIVSFVGGEVRELELAAIYCISNLASLEKGSPDRQDILRKYGIVEKLRTRRNVDDHKIASCAKYAYDQFESDERA